MALLSTVVKTIAEVQNVEEAYVAGVARYLREAGHISQAGRGRGAAHATSRDAANLLIGISVSEVATRSVELTELHHFMKADVAGSDHVRNQFAEIAVPGLHLLPVLETLIEWSKTDASGGNQLEIRLQASVLPEDRERAAELKIQLPMPRLEIEFERPRLGVYLKVQTPRRSFPGGTDDFYHLERSLTFGFSLPGYYDPAPSDIPDEPYEPGDRSVITTFTERTLLRVAQTLQT